MSDFTRDQPATCVSDSYEKMLVWFICPVTRLIGTWRSSVSGPHTRSAQLRSRSSQWLSAVGTRRTIQRQNVMVHSIRVRFVNTCDAFIFDQRRAKHPLPAVALRSRIEQR